MKGSSKKLQLSPIQREIMWSLEEDQETIPTVFNTLRTRWPELPEATFASQIIEGILGLYHLDLVEFSTQVPGKHGPPLRIVQQNESKLVDLLKSIVFDTECQSWRWDMDNYGEQGSAISLTASGRRACVPENRL